MNVSAVIVTRGDVDLAPVLDSLPREWEKVVWDNSRRENLAVYGRYAAIAECEHDAIFVVDDDVVLEESSVHRIALRYQTDKIIANMPQRFRDTGFYEDHCLIGFGAIFHRDLPEAAFEVIARHDDLFADHGFDTLSTGFERTCDVAFTALTPRILVDLPYADREFASAPNRMWKQPDHIAERTRMLELVRQVRDREAA